MMPRIAVVLVVLGTSCGRPPHAIVSVQDPEALADNAVALDCGAARDALIRRPLDGKHFPLTLVLSRDQEGEAPLWVEAKDASDQLLARATATVLLHTEEGDAAQVVLGRPCEGDTECEDGVYCNGTDVCVEHVCSRGAPPCGAGPFDCVEIACVEAARACSTITHHDRCAPIEVEGSSEPTYCDATRGCLRGQSCEDAADCDNGLVCDGEEPCVAGRCLKGSIPRVDDGEPCTTDVCVEPGGRLNVPDLVAEARPCSSTTVAVGLCRAGHCLDSTCGDGVADPRRETCDDGNDNPNDECDQCLRVEWSASVVNSGAANIDPLGFSLPDPTDLAVDSRGAVYASDLSLMRVMRLQDGRLSTAVGGSASAPWGVSTAFGLRAGTMVNVYRDLNLTFDGAESLYVVIGNQTVKVNLTRGAVRGVLSDLGGQFGLNPYRTRALAIDERGVLASARGTEHCVSALFPPNGLTRVIAGTCGASAGWSGDGGLGTNALLDTPIGLATGARGFYIVDSGNHTVRLVSPDGIISTIAGIGVAGFGGDGARAIDATLSSPRGVAIDPTGRVIIADTRNNRLRRIDRNGVISTIAGTGGPSFSGDGGPADRAGLDRPTKVALDPSGNIYLLDASNRRVRRIDAASGEITTVLGTGRGDHPADGKAANRALLNTTRGLARSTGGDICFGDRSSVRCITDSGQQLVTRWSANLGAGVVTSVAFSPSDELHFGQAGKVYRLSGNTAVELPGLGAVDGQAVDDMVFEPSGTVLYTTDGLRNVVRRLDLLTGQATIIAGADGSAGDSGDGGPLVAARLREPIGMVREARGSLVVADFGNNRVRRIDIVANRIEAVAGTGARGDAGDGGAATRATFDGASGVAVLPDGSILIADLGNGRLRRVDGAGVIHAFAGQYSQYNMTGDGGPALDAETQGAWRITVDPRGNVFFSEGSPDDHIRRIDASTGLIDTVGGRLFPLGDGPLTSALLGAPTQIVFGTDPSGADVLLIMDDGYTRAANLATGQLTTITGRFGGALAAPIADSQVLSVGNGLAYDPVDRRIYAVDDIFSRIRVLDLVTGRSSLLQTICGDIHGDHFISKGLLFDAANRRLLVADGEQLIVRAYDVSSRPAQCTTFAGSTAGDSGDGVPASSAQFIEPTAMALAPGGSVYIADRQNHRVRRVDPDGTICHVIGDGQAASSGEGAPARLFPLLDPSGLVVDRHGDLFISSGNAIRQVLAGDDGIARGDDRVITIYGKSPRETFPESATVCLSGIVLGSGAGGEVEGSLYAVDTCRGLLIRLDRRTVPFGG